MKARDLPPEAIDRLLEARERLLAMLSRWTPDRGEAEDLLQAAYVRALERSDTLRAPEKVVGWFGAVVRNLALDRVRRRGIERRVLGEWAHEHAGATLPELSEGELCLCVNPLLEALPPTYADILARVELGDQSIVDAARSMKVSPGAVRVRLHRARKALLKRLVDACGACAAHRCIDCSCRS